MTTMVQIDHFIVNFLKKNGKFGIKILVGQTGNYEQTKKGDKPF
jgi:hypothetical protein